MTPAGRDRLKELLDAVLAGTADGRGATLASMAEAAASSPFHFSRLLSDATGEPPVTMRRRVMLERAAWQLRNGNTVTSAAFAAGYRSVEGFSRAFSRSFGHGPGSPVASHRLPAPNGIHFHPPASLWVDGADRVLNPVVDQLVRHDVADTRHLIVLAATLADDDYRSPRLPGTTLLSWHGPEESIAAVLENHVWTKQVWAAAIAGHDIPARDEHVDAEGLLRRHDAVAPLWVETVRDIEHRGGWDDTLIDALCDPPESFVVGSVITHVLTYAGGRRMVARMLLRGAGVAVDDGDPIDWSRTPEPDERLPDHDTNGA